MQRTHISQLKVLSHEEVDGSAGPRAHFRLGGTEVTQESRTQLGTLLRLFLKHELRELPHDRSLRGKDVLQHFLALVARH